MIGRGIAFLLGTGWWVPWHIFLLSSLLPLGVLVVWFARFDPEGGSQSGEGALALLFLVITILMLVSLLHAGLWVRQTMGGGLGRYLLAVGAWGAGWVLLLLPLLKLANLAARGATRRGVRLAAIVTQAVLLLSVVAANLLFLSWYHRR